MPYSIPVSGLRDGMHVFQFAIGEEFFETFEGSLVQKGTVQVKLEFDKRPSLYVLTFYLEGSIWVECDRCLEPFSLPVQDEQRLTVKFDEEAHEEGDVVYVERGITSFNVARFIYEYICLAVPMIKTHDLAGQQCDPEMLKFLSPGEEEIPGDEASTEEDSIWSVLKNLKNDN